MYNEESWYKNIFKIRNVSFIFKISKKNYNNVKKLKKMVSILKNEWIYWKKKLLDYLLVNYLFIYLFYNCEYTVFKKTKCLVQSLGKFSTLIWKNYSKFCNFGIHWKKKVTWLFIRQ